MKKIMLNLSAVALMGLAMTACNNDEANKKAREADDAAVQTLVDDKAKAMDEEVAKACDEQVTAAATAKADSIVAAENAAAKKAGKPVPHKAPIKKPEPKKPVVVNDPKKDKFDGDGKTKVNADQEKQKQQKLDGNGSGTVTPTKAQEDAKKKKFD